MKTGDRQYNRPILTSLDSVDPQPVQWLWPNRIPLGKLSLLVGDPGVGKSFLTLDIASHITTGKPWPDSDDSIQKGSVILLTAEDGIADTVRPRADAAEADVSKIKVLEGFLNRRGGHDYFTLPYHIAGLEDVIKEVSDTRLIIIDPISAFMGAIDGFKNTAVRGVLKPVAALAEKYNVSIIGVTHLNKSGDMQAVYRTTGSIAYTAAARSVWAVTLDEDDEHRSRRFFIPLKTNLSLDPTSLAFRITEGKVEFEEGSVEINIDTAFSRERYEEYSVLKNAVDWLRQALSNGPLEANDIFRMAEENSISHSTLLRAKYRLGIKSIKEGKAKCGKWSWHLPKKEEKQIRPDEDHGGIGFVKAL